MQGLVELMAHMTTAYEAEKLELRLKPKLCWESQHSCCWFCLVNDREARTSSGESECPRVRV